MAYLHSPLNDGSPSVEEVYVDLDISKLKFGYFRPGIGIINKTHSHTYNFISDPNSINKLFGSHSWASLGMQLGFNIPSPGESRLDLAVFQNNIGEISSASSHSHGLKISADSLAGLVSVSTLKNNIDLRGLGRFSWGVSNTYGRGKAIQGVDFRLKGMKNKFQFWIIQGEFFEAKISERLHGIAYHPDETLTANYLLIGRQFNKSSHLGIIIDDWSYALKQTKGSSYGFYSAYTPAGDDFVVRFKYLTDKINNKLNHTQTVQFSWALGKHRPQRY